MFEQSYSTDTSQRVLNSYNQSLPYTMVYEAQRDMSITQSLQFDYSESSDIGINQVPSDNLSHNSSASPQQSTYHSEYFSPRSHLEIRHSYLSKLMSRGFISQKPRPKYRHLFVFDWDDTLLCTTYLNHFKFSQLRLKDYEMLAITDTYVSKILATCMTKGDLSIITNAAKGWVEYSSQKFMPQTYEFITKKTRSEYGSEFPNEIKKWKVSAFQKLNSAENSHLITNIICIGDSTIEMEAGQILASSFEKSLLKTVKFRENPRIEELIKQQELLDKKLQEIVNTPKNLTIRLQRKTIK